MQLWVWCHRFGAMLAVVVVVGAISTGALAPSSAVGSVSPLTDPAKIEKLAATAYVWGVAPELVYRLGKLQRAGDRTASASYQDPVRG